MFSWRGAINMIYLKVKNISKTLPPAPRVYPEGETSFLMDISAVEMRYWLCNWQDPSVGTIVKRHTQGTFKGNHETQMSNPSVELLMNMVVIVREYTSARRDSLKHSSMRIAGILGFLRVSCTRKRVQVNRKMFICYESVPIPAKVLTKISFSQRLV